MVPEEGWEVLSWTRMEMKALSPGVSPKSAADPSTSSVTPSSLPWVYKSLLRSGALWHLQCSSVTDASSLPNYLGGDVPARSAVCWYWRWSKDPGKQQGLYTDSSLTCCVSRDNLLISLSFDLRILKWGRYCHGVSGDPIELCVQPLA